jgi:hypothetical protein
MKDGVGGFGFSKPGKSAIAAELVEVPRLRGWVALRRSRSAQDEKLVSAIPPTYR